MDVSRSGDEVDHIFKLQLRLEIFPIDYISGLKNRDGDCLAA